jgi:rhamnosyltransferase
VISVIIPVRDGGQDLIRCLDSVLAQQVDEAVEIIVVDSGSTDGSVAAARARSARVFEIPPHAFSHGASRNLGAARASGDILVFISQDAFAVDHAWLARLTAPLRETPQPGGVYGRQLAHDGAVPPEAYFLDFLYGPSPRLQLAGTVSQLSMRTTLFSNVNAAMPRSLWQRYPFVEDIVMSEDQEWSKRVLLAGYTIVYEPRAAVRHSHPYTLRTAFRRFFDSGASSGRAYMAGRSHSARVLLQVTGQYAQGEVAWLWQTRQRRWLPYAALYEATKMLGLLAGANHQRLPLVMSRWLSATPSYWRDDRASQSQSQLQPQPQRDGDSAAPPNGSRQHRLPPGTRGVRPGSSVRDRALR